MKKETLTIRIPEKLYNIFKEESEIMGVSMNSVVTMRLMEIYQEKLNEQK